MDRKPEKNRESLLNKQLLGGIAVLCLVLAPACKEQVGSNGSRGPITSSSSGNKRNIGARAVTINFHTSTGGSFDVPAASTSPGVGNDHAAVRWYKANGASALQPSEATWLKRVGVGITGANNGGTHADCARFGNSTDPQAFCDWDSSGANFDTCGVGDTSYRTASAACEYGGATSPNRGNGTAQDSIYIRFEIDPTQLADDENLQLIIQYIASSVTAGPLQISNCFPNQVATPTACAENAWNIHLSRDLLSSTQPFHLLIPPQTGSVDPVANRGGGATKIQTITIPISSYRDTKYIQISRARGADRVGAATMNAICSPPPQTAAPSTLCSGTMYRSATLVRF